MEELLKSINKEYGLFWTNSADMQAGNKAAGRRARTASTRLGKLLKEFRKVSME